MAKSKILMAALFLASFFLSVQFFGHKDSLTGLRWGTHLEVAQAREK